MYLFIHICILYYTVYNVHTTAYTTPYAAILTYTHMHIYIYFYTYIYSYTYTQALSVPPPSQSNPTCPKPNNSITGTYNMDKMLH